MPISSSPVNQAVGSATTSPIPVTITAPTNGNTLLACIAINSKTSVRTVTGITGTGTSGWINVGQANFNGLNSIEIWMGTVGAGAGTSISITLSSSQINNACVNVSEWSGLTNTALISALNQSGLSTAPSVAMGIVSGGPVAGNLALAMAMYANGTTPTGVPSWGARLTFANSGTALGLSVNYLVLATSAAPATASWTITSASWVAESGYGVAAASTSNWLTAGYWWQRATESSGSF